MATLEERIAYLEGKVEEHSRGFAGLREATVHLEQRLDARFEAIDRRFEQVDRRFEQIERRLDALDRKLDQQLAALDHKLDERTRGLDEKISRQFVQLVGIQVTTLVTVVGVLAAALLAR